MRGRPFVGERHGELLIRTRDRRHPEPDVEPTPDRLGQLVQGPTISMLPAAMIAATRSGCHHAPAPTVFDHVNPQSVAAVSGRGRSWHDFSNRVQGRLGR